MHTLKVNESESVEKLSLVCPNIRVLNIQGLFEVKEIELKTKTRSMEVIIIKGQRSIEIEITEFD